MSTPKKRKLDSQETSNKRSRKTSKNKKSKLPCLDVFGDVKLSAEQVRAVTHLYASTNKTSKGFHGLVVAHGTGTGKTEIILGAIACAGKHNVKRVVLVTTKSLIDEFEKRMKKYNFKVAKQVELQVVTYAKFCNDLAARRSTCSSSTLLIVDEAHNLRNPMSKRYLEIQSCASVSKYVMVLTATPFVNSAADIAVLFRLIMTPAMSGKYSTTYLTRLLLGFSNTKSTSNSKKDNLVQLAKLAPFKNRVSYFYTSKHDTNFPRVDTHVEKFKMSPAYEREYVKLEHNVFDKLVMFDKTKDLSAFYTALRTSTHKIGEQQSTKFERIKKLLLAKKQTVLYSEFLASGVAIFTEFMKANNVSFAVVTGSISALQRKEAVDKYNKQEVRVLIISKAGEVGLDLKNTRQIIFATLPWNFATYEQVVGRGVRFKSHESLPQKDRQVDVYVFLQTKEPSKLFNESNSMISRFASIDDYLWSLIEEKRTQKEGLDGLLSRLSVK
jgi:superfamily II DNA or RNA helicase